MSIIELTRQWIANPTSHTKQTVDKIIIIQAFTMHTHSANPAVQFC